MKFATWNVNSLKIRLPQVLHWLTSTQVDVLCLQELKLPDEAFPAEAFSHIGYQACWAGQKTYNGVAIVTRGLPLTDVQRGIPGFEDPQQRLIMASIDGGTLGPLRVASAYCPNGQALDSEKYPYKLAWYEALIHHLETELKRNPRLLVLGDYNIAPTDADVHDPVAWQGQVLVSDAERASFQRLLALGLHDSFRLFDQPPRSFSWWDYRQLAFRRNAGLRIDHILVSDVLRPHCVACSIDREPRKLPQPSDHTPVVLTLG
jgi:exodeoxyribonuclease-3